MLLLVFSVLTFAVGFIGALVVTAYPTLPALAVVGITLAGLVTMLARSWQVGTYVSDHGVRDITFRRTTQVPWSDVTSIESDRRRVQLNTRFDSVSPHVARHGLDFIGRHEAYDMAVDRLTNWWQQR
jgi:cytochrome c biogenesis protein CcdA